MFALYIVFFQILLARWRDLCNNICKARFVLRDLHRLNHMKLPTFKHFYHTETAISYGSNYQINLFIPPYNPHEVGFTNEETGAQRSL